MIRLLIYIVLFVASLAAIVAGGPGSTRRHASWSAAALLFGCILLGALLGIAYGWLFGPADGGPVVGAMAFGEVGFFTGICAVVYRATIRTDADAADSPPQQPMPLAIAIAIPLCALIAAPIGWLLPIEDDGERAFMPVVTALAGVMVGAVFGIVYEKGKAGLLAVVGFIVLSLLSFLLIAWLEGS